MLVTPTFPTAVLVGLATVLMVVGVLTTHAPMLAWSGAMIFGLAVGRLLNRTAIARARAAGFEMVWKEAERFITAYRHSELVLVAELRNRSNELLVLETIAPLTAPELRVELTPTATVLPAHSSIKVELTVTPLRVGLHGVQGITVVLRDDSAVFESQLTFANPLVIEVRPERLRLPKQPFYGGRGVCRALASKTRPLSGDSLELREVREMQRGDPLRKIAWKASGRRGKLLVRDDEQEQHHRLHIVLDASVELWSGTLGESALDVQLDRVASVIRYALRRGDRVGLTVVASRVLSSIAPDASRNHENRLLCALTHSSATRDHDRSGLDEQDAAMAVLEHLRPVEPLHTRKLTAVDGDKIARLALRHLVRAPFAIAPEPLAPTPRERLLRQYLTAFGLPSPPRSTTERDQTDRTLVETLKELISTSPDRIVICSPWPTPRLAQGLGPILRRLRKARIALEWLPVDTLLGLPAPSGSSGPAVEQALRWHAESSAEKGELALRRLGIHTMRVPPLSSAVRTLE